MTSRAVSPSVRYGVWGILAVLLGFVAWDGVGRSRHMLALSERYGVTVDAPAIDARSPTGYADGRRSLVLPEGEADTAHWIMQTQAMIAAGELRVRHVDYDNAPQGRDVHWAAPFHWWLATLAWVDHWVSGRPLGISVERSVLLSGPVMLGLLLLGLTPLLARRFSPWAAALGAGGSVTVFAFYTDFLPARADHHGLVNICSLFNVLCLLVASTSDKDLARRWFAGSAVAAGLGLWISAATEAPVLVGIGLGVLAAGWVGRGASARIAWLAEPGLWRFWGRVGGAVSFAAYLLEYFPSHLGMRLEVNHPLYALAWLGAGEALSVAIRALRDGVRSVPGRDVVRGCVGAGLTALLPIVIALTAARTFVVADPFVWRLHTLYIAEFKGLASFLTAKDWNWATLNPVLPMLWLVPAVWLAGRRSVSSEARAQLLLALAPAVVSWLMGWNQIRWLGLAYALSVPVMAEFFRLHELPGAKTRATLWAAAFGLVLLPGAASTVQRTLAHDEFTSEEIRSLVERDVAQWLRLRGGPDRVVVMASPTPTTRLIYHGGLTGVDTLYWENAAGLKAAAELYAAPSGPAAREIATRLGLTHLVFFSWGSFEIPLTQLQRGLPPDAPWAKDTFAARLLSAPVPPPWLRLVPFKLPDHPALADAHLLIWEVVPDQTPATALARSANFFLELGRLPDAQRLMPELAQFENDLPATIMLAAIASRQHDEAGFATVFAHILGQLEQAPALALDEHIHLVVVLAVGQRPDLARAQLRLCVEQADARSLRQLPPGTLADLLALSDALEVALPAPARQLAESLLPPDQRK